MLCGNQHVSLMNRDEELVTEIAWVVVYLSALSSVATSVLVKTDLLQLLVQRLASSNSLQLLIPVRKKSQLIPFAYMFSGLISLLIRIQLKHTLDSLIQI